MTTASMQRRRARIEADDDFAYRASRGGKRIDESGTFSIPAYTYRRDPWEREFLKRALTPPGAHLGRPVFMPTKQAFEFEWKRTLFKMKEGR